MKKIFLIAVILIITDSILMASYKEALELYKSKRYKESLQIIADELQIEKDKEPDSPNYKLRFLAAHNHWKLGNSQASITHFRRCIDIKKDDVNPLIDLSLLLYEIKRYKDSRTFTRKALKIKDIAIGYYILGKIALQYGNFREAKVNFEKSISRDPGISISYNGLGIALMRLRKFTQANTAFSAAMAIDSESPEVLNNIGLSFERTGKLNNAIKYIKKASVISPHNPVIQKNLTRLSKKARESTSK